MAVYDRAFNLNEWFVLITIFLTAGICLLLPRRFPASFSILILLYCMVFGMSVDHTISVPPYDFYDVNDNSAYNWMDWLTYVLYAPFGYLFVYFYDRWRVRGRAVLLYLIGCTVGGVSFEWVCEQIGIFHYDKGYSMIYSIPSYLIAQSLLLLYFEFLKRVYHIDSLDVQP